MRKTAVRSAGVVWVIGALAWALSGWVGPAGAAQRADPLAGVWKVTVTPDEGGKAYEDTLTLKGGQLSSAKLKAKGFEDAAYDEDVRGGQVVTFTATSKGKKGATAKWTGTASLGEISGSVAVDEGDGSAVTYAYKGKRAGK